MKVAYILQSSHKKNFAGISVARGFGNAFKRLGFDFSEFDVESIKRSFHKAERQRLLEFEPEVVLASVEHMNYIPYDQMRGVTFVLWGQFYERNALERDCVTITEATKRHLLKSSKYSRIIIWSQHSDEINAAYFSGYEKELGLTFVQLLHCADDTLYEGLDFKNASLDYDFVWIGKVKHRKSAYNEFVAPLKSLSRNYIEITENRPMSPDSVAAMNPYVHSKVCPNVHTEAQRENRILLNERTFVIPVMGGFEITDNSLARKYFSENEMIVAQSPKDFIEMAGYFMEHPEDRLPFIERCLKRVLSEHTYKKRINTILSLL